MFKGENDSIEEALLYSKYLMVARLEIPTYNTIAKVKSRWRNGMRANMNL